MVPNSVKKEIISWIESLNMFKSKGLDEDVFAQTCTIGVIYCDLINRLEGRSAPLKGIERRPKNKTQALANVKKALGHLRQYQKFPSRCLWAANSIIDGEETAIWNLLVDIKQYYAVPKPRNQSTTKKNNAMSTKNELLMTYDFLEKKSNTLRGFSKYQAETQHKSKREVKEWLSALDITVTEGDNLLNDPVRNGELLCELIKVIERVKVPVNSSPGSPKAVRNNFERALEALKNKNPGIPKHFYNDLDLFLENQDHVWNLLQDLQKYYPLAVPLYYQPSVLPYGAIQIKKTEEQVIDWLINISIVNNRPSFFDIILEMKSGMLLCELVMKLMHAKIPNIVINPTSKQSALNNVRKALEILRNASSFPQRFTGNEKEIVKGNPGVVLGILEDFYSFFRNQVLKEGKDSLDYFLEQMGIYPDYDDLREFRNGVLLCDIVSQLTNTKIPGVVRDPQNSRVAMKNIDKALSILSAVPQFPTKLLQSQELIYNGDRNTILSLLKQITKLY